MNIWLEGVDGTGKTTLAKALGEALGVEPLYHVTHKDLPDRPYNVIDRHADITNSVYKDALPGRFKDWPDSGTKPCPSSFDLYVFLRFCPDVTPQVCDYSTDEITKLEHAYTRFFLLNHAYVPRLLSIKQTSEGLEFTDYVTDPFWVRRICVGDDLMAFRAQEAVEVKSREILRIVRETESQQCGR